MKTKIERRQKIKYRVRNKISGTAERPRLSVFRSNKQIYAQVINDENGRTLVAASSLGIKEFEIDEISMLPKEKITLEGDDLELFKRLYNMLDEVEDVKNIYHNVEL